MAALISSLFPRVPLSCSCPYFFFCSLFDRSFIRRPFPPRFLLLLFPAVPWRSHRFPPGDICSQAGKQRRPRVSAPSFISFPPAPARREYTSITAGAPMFSSLPSYAIKLTSIGSAGLSSPAALTPASRFCPAPTLVNVSPRPKPSGRAYPCTPPLRLRRQDVSRETSCRLSCPFRRTIPCGAGRFPRECFT